MTRWMFGSIRGPVTTRCLRAGRICGGRPTSISKPRTSVALYGQAPYREVLTHAFVVDVDSRQKLSKSQQGAYAKPTEAEYFVKKYGADLVRLWVASVNFADEVP